MDLIEGRFLGSPCVGCGKIVYTIPAYVSLGRCVDCGRTAHGAAVPVRPVPGRNNWMRLGGQTGQPNPGRLVDRRNVAVERAAAKLGERAGRLVEVPRVPAEGDGLPRTFWSLAFEVDAVPRIGAWEVWRSGDSRAERETGWWLQWRAAVAAPADAGRWSVTTWRCWEGPGEKWVKLGISHRGRLAR